MSRVFHQDDRATRGPVSPSRTRSGPLAPGQAQDLRRQRIHRALRRCSGCHHPQAAMRSTHATGPALSGAADKFSRTIRCHLYGRPIDRSSLTVGTDPLRARGQASWYAVLREWYTYSPFTLEVRGWRSSVRPRPSRTLFAPGVRVLEGILRRARVRRAGALSVRVRGRGRLGAEQENELHSDVEWNGIPGRHVLSRLYLSTSVPGSSQPSDLGTVNGTLCQHPLHGQAIGIPEVHTFQHQTQRFPDTSNHIDQNDNGKESIY